MAGQRGRPFVVEWQESAAELERQYRQEKGVPRRTRLHALWLLRRGKRLDEVGEVLGVHYRTLQRWVAWYRAGGLAEVLRRTPGGQREGQQGWLTEGQGRQLRATVDTGVFHSAQDVAAWMEGQWGVSYSVGGIYSLFRRLGITKKVPRRQAEQADVAQQAAWKKGAWRRR